MLIEEVIKEDTMLTHETISLKNVIIIAYNINVVYLHEIH